MVVATQFALIDLEYEYHIIPFHDYGVRFIGLDNSSDGLRVLRTAGTTQSGDVKLVLGNFSSNYQVCYTAAFGIVNEEKFSLDITHIEVISSNATYLKIWLHGVPNKNANNRSNDPSSILMYNNGTIVNKSNTVAWTLAQGDNNANTLCSKVSLPKQYSNITPIDTRTGVRYSPNQTVAESKASDFVWVQVELETPLSITTDCAHLGNIIIHFKRE
jgi:hypothetical protein